MTNRETQAKPENVKWLLDASNQVIKELGEKENLDSDTFRWLCNAVGQVERDLKRAALATPETPSAGVSAADVANLIAEFTDGVLWKQPDADGHVSRFTNHLNALLATPAAAEEPQNFHGTCPDCETELMSAPVPAVEELTALREALKEHHYDYAEIDLVAQCACGWKYGPVGRTNAWNYWTAHFAALTRKEPGAASTKGDEQ